MSRSCAADEAGLRQHRSRLMQLATATSHASSHATSHATTGSTKRRAYSAQHALFKSAPTPRHSGIPGKLLSFEEVVRNDPSYTPNIEHLVFPSRRNSIPTKPGAGGGGGGTGGGGKSARARLAEVFALTRSQGSRKANSQSQSHEKTKSRENSITRSSISQKVGGGGSERGVSGGGGAEPVCTDEGGNRSQVAAQSSVVPASGMSVSQSGSNARELESAPSAGSNRGPNVSVLHLRSTSEPWETAPVRSTAGGGSRRQHSQQQQQSAPPPKQKSQEQSGKVTRELSPVRWCDREVDGVYLGRSGWVQVQQRSLDDNRRMKYKPEMTSNLHSRIKMADYHCSKSEPGKLPPPPLLRQEEMVRPGYLPLPGESRRTKEKPSPSSLDLSHEEPITPPPVTPIISPPPAFQDTNKQRFDPPPRTRPFTKPPFLSRSNAVELSPPPSPPRSTFRTPDPKITAALGGPIAARNRWFGPAPVTTSTSPGHPGHSAPPQHTKSLEESAARRTLFQKYGDSSSSSSSSFGFRSLDNTLAARSLAMPRLTETDSSIGGYEDGYEEDNVITLVSSSPESATTAAERDRSRQLLRQARRSPGSDGSGKKLGSNSPHSSSSSSDDGSRSPFRRPPSSCQQGSNSHHSQANSHHSHAHLQTPKHGSGGGGVGGGNSGGGGGGISARVRRSRSLQLPERKSPVSPAQAQTQQAYYTSKGYPVVVKVGDDQQQRIKRHLLQQQRMSEEAQKREELLRREAEAVTEFLWSARSREAARALLSHRVNTSHQQQQQQQQQQQPSFNVVFVGGNNSKSQRTNYGQSSSQRTRGLQRGSSTPVSKGSSPVGGFCPNPCNPTTCDFWPHCAHRDGIYTTTKASTPASCVVTPVPPTSLRLSQSYPNTSDRSDKRSRLEPNARQNYQSIRSSPASLERVDHDASPDRIHSFQTRRGNSLNVSPEWRSAVGPQCCQHLHPPRRTHEKPGFKVGLSDTSSSSVDAYQPPRSGDTRSPGDMQTCLGDKVVSPIEVNSVIVNQVSGGGDTLSPSSSSSSSSEVWLTTSDRTLTKSPRRTPQDEVARLPGDLESRPGSAPGGATTQPPLVTTSRLPYKTSTSANSGGGTLEPQHRSLSLPKSFQAKESLTHRSVTTA